MKKILYIAILVIVVLAMLVPATVTCIRGGGETVSGTGTLTFVDLEGGFHGILGDDGKKYDPVNLGQAFHQDGLRVRFEATVRSDLVSTHQWGTMVEITRIEKLTAK